MDEEVKSLRSKLTRTASRQADPLLDEALQRIYEYRNLEEDWDGEDALPVAPGTISVAREVTILTAHRAGKRTISWQIPRVSPDPRGRLHLLWCSPQRRALLIVSANQIVSVRTEAGQEPIREEVVKDIAIEHALWALQGE